MRPAGFVRACVLAALGLGLAAALLGVVPAGHALPEYAVTTGEPCASCHLSPSGGGGRTPRGQAWVGAGRPGTVPALAESLAALGVTLPNDLSIYTTPPESVPAAEPLAVPEEATLLRQWLSQYGGN
jgi:hypothetical protein